MLAPTGKHISTGTTMAASASISSCFSTTIPSHHLSKLPSHSYVIGTNSLHVAVPRVAPRMFLEHLSIVSPARVTAAKSRFRKDVAAAVSQEEAVTVAEVEEEVAAAAPQEEEEAVTAVEEEEEAAAPQEESVTVVEEETAPAPEEEAAAEPADELTAEQPAGTKLYFGNLPYNCDSAMLAGILQDYASPEMIEVLYDRVTGKSRGFAFVVMSCMEDCELVIKSLDGSQIAGRTLRVNFADKPRPKVPLYPETEHKLFVGNLSWSATAESLAELFGDCGEVVGARVVYDGETGKSRGYGFVSYKTKEQMEQAMETLDGTDLDGRPIRISVAMGRKS